MKIIKEEYKNFPKNTTTVVTAVEGQALADTKEFDKRAEETAKEIDIKLPVDGAPKAEKPKAVIIPDALKESLAEDINEENAARIVQETIKHNFGVDVDVATYKDADDSKCVIVEFIASKADCRKMPYDELKEELYKRFGTDINISSKQFSSPNLKNKGTEYKLKIFVLKEKKDKSKIYAEHLTESVAPEKLAELSKALNKELTEKQAEAIKDRWWGFYQNPTKYAQMSPLLIDDLKDFGILNEGGTNIEGDANSMGGSLWTGNSGSDFDRASFYDFGIPRTRPYIITTLLPEFFSDLGDEAKVQEDDGKIKLNERRKLIKQYLEDTYGIRLIDASSLHWDAKNKCWEVEILGSEDALNNFMKVTGIKELIRYGVDPQTIADIEQKQKEERKAKKAAGEKVDDDSDDAELTLVDLIDIELDADQGWSGQLKYRRIPTTEDSGDYAFTRFGQKDLVPNANRYNTEEIDYTYDGDIKVSAGGLGRGKTEHTLDFAQRVADAYKDYGVYFKPNKEGTAGTIVIPEEYKEKPIWEEEQERRKELYADAYNVWEQTQKDEKAAKAAERKAAKAAQAETSDTADEDNF